MSALTWTGVAAIGGVGAIARLLMDSVVSTRAGRGFPVGTLAVNITGSLGLGLLAGSALAGDALLLVGTGLIGSYTTFSTWMYESQRLVEDGDHGRAVLNVSTSLALGFGAVLAGRAIGELL